MEEILLLGNVHIFVAVNITHPIYMSNSSGYNEMVML